MVQKKLTEKLYVSPSTGEPCDSAQYIAELMCSRKAVRDGNNLAYKFWNKTQKDSYKGQIVSARKLINKFGDKAILAWLNKSPNVYSIGHFSPLKFVVEGVSREKDRLDLEESRIIIEEVKEPVNLNTPKQFQKSGSLLSKIKKAENNG